MSFENPENKIEATAKAIVERFKNPDTDEIDTSLTVEDPETGENKPNPNAADISPEAIAAIVARDYPEYHESDQAEIVAAVMEKL